MASVAELVAHARERLLAAGVPPDESAGDAEVLARHVLGWDLTRYAVARREPAPSEFAAAYDASIARRAAREPVSQIVGHREFWGLDFEVTRDVLTPRPETELIVQAALDVGRNPPSSSHGLSPWPSVIIDIGTGSGCLAVALAKEFPDATIIASDVSLAAITVARRNAARHDVSRRVVFMHGGWIPPENDVEIIVSNPPYIPLRDQASLAPEVRDYEPAVALFGGPDGLDFYRRLLFDCVGHLNPDGWLIVEVGYDQAAAVRALAEPHYWEEGPTYRDLQGIERVLTFRALRRYRGQGLEDEEDDE